VASDYATAVLTEILIFVLFAASLHFLVGQSGVLTFGHAAYFGLGAYGAAMSVKYLKLGMLPALALAPLVAGIGAALFGWFCIRLGGVYRAMLTLALAQIVFLILLQWIDVTGGDNGILQVWPASWASSREAYYLFTLLVCALGVLAIWRMIVSPFGYALRAGRDSPLRSAAVGIHVNRLQWTAFVLAGMAAGIAGGLYGFAKGSVFPNSASIETSVDVLVMVLLGGIEMTLGPVVGATIYHWLQAEIMRSTDYWRAILGAAIILIVVVFPDGIAGTLARHLPRLRRASQAGTAVQKSS
jgi:branched-chain amino acid transport system permease protein